MEPTAGVFSVEVTVLRGGLEPGLRPSGRCGDRGCGPGARGCRHSRVTALLHQRQGQRGPTSPGPPFPLPSPPPGPPPARHSWRAADAEPGKLAQPESAVPSRPEHRAQAQTVSNRCPSRTVNVDLGTQTEVGGEGLFL